MIRKFRFTGDSVRSDIVENYEYQGDLVDIYSGNEGPLVHKWHHYLPIYDRYFSSWRGKPVRFLEIGVSLGGSLEMWRSFFGPEAVIYGIDINPDCARFDGGAGQVRIGSQADEGFLNRVVEEMGGIDIVLDDGSHHMDHISTSMDVLFPQLEMGGIYMVEDLQTCYWPRFGGALNAPKNFFNRVRSLIDDMHHWYHDAPLTHPQFQDQIDAIHVHDSITVFEKQPSHRPTHSRIGHR